MDFGQNSSAPAFGLGKGFDAGFPELDQAKFKCNEKAV
jgi:hypothetical protein